MTPLERTLYEEFPDSPHALQLKKGLGALRFQAPLESLFIAKHSFDVRFRVRLWMTVSLLLSSLMLPMVVSELRMTVAFWLYVLVLWPSSLCLAVLSWSRLYTRWYLDVASYLVPVTATVTGIFVAQTALDGSDKSLTSLSMGIMAGIFFSGLLFRSALVTAVLIPLSFFLGELAHAVPVASIINSLTVLIVPSVAGVVVYRDIELSGRRKFLEDALVEELVSRDRLSGLMNRRALDEHLSRIWNQGIRDRCAVVILMADIDHFKAYNDQFGHMAGDAALRTVAQVLKRFARRPLDFAARYGGEEFAIVLYDLSIEDVLSCAEQIRQTVQEEVGGSLRTGCDITVSIGVCRAVPMARRTPQDVVQLADEALYEAKRQGRNRVVAKGASDLQLVSSGRFKVSA